jgi:DNA mismatch endonuclease (patch repair protein)
LADVFIPEQRSRVMAAITGKDTRPERIVRRRLHALGYRFRLHRKDLPGRPDVVLPRHGAVVFVHGCFWHGHPRCRRARLPATRTDFWRDKIEKNRARDRRDRAALRRLGWRVLTLWECSLRDEERLTDRLRRFLEGDSGPPAARKRGRLRRDPALRDDG